LTSDSSGACQGWLRNLPVGFLTVGVGALEVAPDLILRSAPCNLALNAIVLSQKLLVRVINRLLTKRVHEVRFRKVLRKHEKAGRDWFGFCWEEWLIRDCLEESQFLFVP